MSINKKGQALIEYLMLVALMAVASFSVMILLSHSVRGKFVQIVDEVQGSKSTQVRFDRPQESDYKKRDMSDFMNGASKRQ
jgi:pilus assembly protein Flp/PilA